MLYFIVDRSEKELQFICGKCKIAEFGIAYFFINQIIDYGGLFQERTSFFVGEYCDYMFVGV